MIVGTGAIRRVDDRECELTCMFSAAAYCGRGIGQAIAQRLTASRDRWISKIRLSSNKMLAALHRLWRICQFRATPLAGADGANGHFTTGLEI